jgi:hypothetical protein
MKELTHCEATKGFDNVEVDTIKAKTTDKLLGRCEEYCLQSCL